MDNKSARTMWNSFRVQNSQSADCHDEEGVEAWAFGIGEEMETALAELVIRGTKRATASSYNGLVTEGEPIPREGGYSIILDGRGDARCIIKTTNVFIAPLSSVTQEFALREGEGDKSVEYWLEGHRTFFRDEHEQLGIPFYDEIPVVYEEFVVVWPPEVADR